MYAEKIRLKDKAERKRRVSKDNKADKRSKELRAMIDQDLVDKARRFKKARERHKDLGEEARNKVACPTTPLTSTHNRTGLGDLPEFEGDQLLHPRGPRAQGREVESEPCGPTFGFDDGRNYQREAQRDQARRTHPNRRANHTTADQTLVSEAPARKKQLLEEGEGCRPYQQNPGATSSGGSLGLRETWHSGSSHKRYISEYAALALETSPYTNSEISQTISEL